MKTTSIGSSAFVSSRLSYGCWRISGSGSAEDQAHGRSAVIAAYEAGYTLFDHADIYGGGECEKIFGGVLKETPAMRGHILIATKCGIRFVNEPAGAPFRYDFSADHILRACDRSLERLGIETIDIYQLHRPDWLMNPEEVAAAFDKLRAAGKVREFGVSNFKPSQVAALQKACPMRLVVNQVEISLANRLCFEDGTLDQCLAEKITPMAWSPLAGGLLGNGARRLLPWQNDYRTQPIVEALGRIARERNSTPTAVALAWLLKHPGNIVPIVGSTDPGRIRAAVKADELELSREEWYTLLEAARGERLP